jgi:hypothetical protein
MLAGTHFAKCAPKLMATYLFCAPTKIGEGRGIYPAGTWGAAPTRAQDS